MCNYERHGWEGARLGEVGAGEKHVKAHNHLTEHRQRGSGFLLQIIRGTLVSVPAASAFDLESSSDKDCQM